MDENTKGAKLYGKYMGNTVSVDKHKGIVCGYCDEGNLIVAITSDTHGWNYLSDGDHMVTHQDHGNFCYWLEPHWD
jgi:hypothetical protein